jgi:hypothetical protein
MLLNCWPNCLQRNRRRIRPTGSEREARDGLSRTRTASCGHIAEACAVENAPVDLLARAEGALPIGSSQARTHLDTKPRLLSDPWLRDCRRYQVAAIVRTPRGAMGERRTPVPRHRRRPAAPGAAVPAPARPSSAPTPRTSHRARAPGGSWRSSRQAPAKSGRLDAAARTTFDCGD